MKSTQTPFTNEDDLSRAVKIWLNKLNEIGSISTVHFHVPNEFKPHKSAMKAWAKKKSIGCVAGAPDWVVVWQGGCLMLELKNKSSLKTATTAMRDNQKDFARECEKRGLHYRLVWDKESFIDALKSASLIK